MHAGVVSGDHVEPVSGVDDLAAVGLDHDLAAAVHRGVDHREHGRRDQGGVVDEQRHTRHASRAPAGRARTRSGRRRGLGVLADEVGDRGVPVALNREQVGKAASITDVFPVPGGPYSSAATPASRNRCSAVTSGIPDNNRGW